MKTHKEVDFLTVYTVNGNISYTHTPYEGASIFQYKTEYLPTNKIIFGVIYGVTKEQGNNLLNFWNKQQPKTWRYTELNISL